MQQQHLKEFFKLLVFYSIMVMGFLFLFCFFYLKGTRSLTLLVLHSAGQAAKPALAWWWQGTAPRHFNNAKTQGCSREPAADGHMEIPACCSDTLLGPVPCRPGSEGAKPEGTKFKRAKPKDAKSKDAKPKGFAAQEQQERGRNNSSTPGRRCQLHGH